MCPRRPRGSEIFLDERCRNRRQFFRFPTTCFQGVSESSGVGRGGHWGHVPPKFSKVPFFGGKCPSDHVNNFVEIENFFQYFWKKLSYVRTKFSYFEKNYDISGKILLFS